MSQERPKSFTTEMVRAILARTKTHMREPMKSQPPNGATEVYVEAVYEEWVVTYRAFPDGGSARHAICACRFGAPGDRLWVQECWRMSGGPQHQFVVYRADNSRLAMPDRWDAVQRYGTLWRQSTHMPRWASRITLEVKRVWVEQVQDISEEDAAAEGHWNMRSADGMSGWGAGPPAPCDYMYRNTFRHCWNSIYAKRGLGWDDNPWVNAAEFELIETEKARDE